MAHWTTSLYAGAIVALACGTRLAQSAVPVSRGQLLYNTHCVACHDMQVHWRATSLATNWTSLLKQVRRWQGVANLQWSEEDVTLVAHDLNDTIYDYPAEKIAPGK